MYKKLPFRTVIKIMNFWPPYLGAGVKVKLLDPKTLKIRVEMPLKIFNKNYIGVHFGGSLYSMVDPFYMLILMNKIGRDFIVWDKSASIKFVRPGKGRVWAEFNIDDQTVSEIENKARELKKFEPEFQIEIRDENNQIVAIVDKKLWVSLKKEKSHEQ
ncbi:MAG: tetrameric acyl-CoA thioesterase [Bdellovibrio sp. CG12_big_fil_rev_8_21_14_0_65_39_13]|nr:MAG: tetrameric acyl-CoA thioesterase [Bdellovibrio sp. CG22_combo_CG10-13_8_21_14_all_39_27]PIQ58235.1 MAG: tetrameric acyl-CoA thioesterase [Bdellovibrio sp. CG12_big_fil_rev_8_21_14_0_65_39_13]PIR36644.1 MAG: tetrameric acyl-CoA thioesterase [Bdellovibrio sp. CG11_big_fil_rev_8_21_14_0_20_39_38]PJB53387.1 MAG: tetrameric acyl-CoA thioesterase [Bdellovibrio sp. CG_4_9_14_3_um_filter_39_7]